MDRRAILDKKGDFWAFFAQNWPFLEYAFLVFFRDFAKKREKCHFCSKTPILTILQKSKKTLKMGFLSKKARFWVFERFIFLKKKYLREKKPSRDQSCVFLHIWGVASGLTLDKKIIFPPLFGGPFFKISEKKCTRFGYPFFEKMKKNQPKPTHVFRVFQILFEET